GEEVDVVRDRPALDAGLEDDVPRHRARADVLRPARSLRRERYGEAGLRELPRELRAEAREEGGPSARREVAGRLRGAGIELDGRGDRSSGAVRESRSGLPGDREAREVRVVAAAAGPARVEGHVHRRPARGE